MAAELEPGDPSLYPLKPNPYAELAPEALDSSYAKYLEALRDPREQSASAAINSSLSQLPPKALEAPAAPNPYPNRGPAYRPGIARDVLADLRNEDGPVAEQPQTNAGPSAAEITATASTPFRRRRISAGSTSTSGAGTALLERVARQYDPDQTMRLRVDPTPLDETQPIIPSPETPIADEVHYSQRIGRLILEGSIFVDTSRATSPLFEQLEAELGYDPTPVKVAGIDHTQPILHPLPPQFERPAPETDPRYASAQQISRGLEAMRTGREDTLGRGVRIPEQPSSEVTAPEENTEPVEANQNMLEGASPITVADFAAQFAAKIRTQESVKQPEADNAEESPEISDGAYQLSTTPFFVPPRGVTLHEDYPHRQEFITSAVPLSDMSLRIHPGIVDHAARTSTEKLRTLQGKPQPQAPTTPHPAPAELTQEVPSPLEQAREAVTQAIERDPEILHEATSDDTERTAPKDPEFAKLHEELESLRREMADSAPAVVPHDTDHMTIAAMTAEAPAAVATPAIALEMPRVARKVQRRGVRGLVDRFLRRR